MSDPRCSFSLFHVEHLSICTRATLGGGERILGWWDDGEENFFFSLSPSHGDCKSLFLFLKIDLDIENKQRHISQYRRLVQKKVDRKHVSSHQGKSDDLHLLAFD